MQTNWREGEKKKKLLDEKQKENTDGWMGRCFRTEIVLLPLAAVIDGV